MVPYIIIDTRVVIKTNPLHNPAHDVAVTLSLEYSPVEFRVHEQLLAFKYDYWTTIKTAVDKRLNYRILPRIYLHIVYDL